MFFSVHLHVRKGPAKRRTGFLQCKKGEPWFIPPICACEKAEKTIGLRIRHPTGHNAAFLLTGGCGDVMSNRNIIVYSLLLGFFFCCILHVLEVGLQVTLAPMVTTSSFA